MPKEGKLICIKQCCNCGVDVEIHHKKRLLNKHIFCSRKCEAEFRRRETEEKHKELFVQCFYCGKMFYMKKSQQERYRHHFCSTTCASKWKETAYCGAGNHQYGLLGDKNSSWKSDEKITNYGYRKIRMLDHPFCDCDGFVFEHRLVAEKYLLTDENSITIGNTRYLSPEYVVHHIDRNKLNNDVSNLVVMTKSEHARLHALKNK
mgnify:CR=1 FL=1